MRALRLASLLFVAVMLTTAAVSQTAGPAPTPNEKAQWLERANLITASIQEDANSLPPDLQMILPGKLGGIWRSVDPKRAQAWLDQAVATLTTPPEQESADERKARFRAAYALFPELDKSDHASADHLLDYLVADAKQKAAANPRGPQYTSEVMAFDHALHTAMSNPEQPKDPDRIFALAQRAIEVRDGNAVLPAYQTLRSADSQRADRFALQALEAARSNYDSFLLFGLAQVASPQVGLPERMKAPQELRSQILDVLAAGMLRPAQRPGDKQAICQLASPVTMAMKAFPPAQQAQLRIAVENCKATDARLSENVNTLEIHSRDAASGELLRQAGESNDAHSRAALKQKAAEQASAEKDFSRALDIMDTFTAEERESLVSWETRWSAIAQNSIFVSYSAHDLQAIQQVIARAPNSVRATLMMMAATRGFASKDTAYGMTMLTQAHRELEKNPVTSDYRPYMQLLTLYAANASEQAVGVLRLAIVGINNFKIPEGAKSHPTAPGSQLATINVPASLLDSDPQMVSAAVSELKSPQARVAMRLGLLQACLQRYQGPAKPPAPKSDSKPPAAPTLKTDAKPAAKPEAEQKKN